MARRETRRNTSDDENVTQRDEKQEVVFVYTDGRVMKTEVETGIQDNNSIEILKGIKVGDEVVTAPYTIINRTLKDSMQVKKVDEEDLLDAKDTLQSIKQNLNDGEFETANEQLRDLAKQLAEIKNSLQ